MRMIPNVITLMNLILGMIAVLMSLDGVYQIAAILVLVGMILDAMDGRVARALGAQSDFGKELDSLADIVTFGVAPTVIMYTAVLRDFGLLGQISALVFPVAGALRLARFNVVPGHHRYFVGLPITAAGGILAAFALYHGLIAPFWMPIMTLALALLMVSRTRYPNFKRVGPPPISLLILPLVVIGIALLFLSHRILIPRLIFAVLVIYGGYGVWYEGRTFFRRWLKRRAELHRTSE